MNLFQIRVVLAFASSNVSRMKLFEPRCLTFFPFFFSRLKHREERRKDLEERIELELLDTRCNLLLRIYLCRIYFLDVRLG